MNWDALGAIGETLGAIAVLVTLGYLAVQVRHARDEVARSSRQARFQSLTDFYSMQATNPELAEAGAKLRVAMDIPLREFMKATVDMGLTETEARLVASFWGMLRTMTERTIDAMDDLSPGQRAQAHARFRINLGSGIGAVWYASSKLQLNPDAVRYIDNLLAQTA